MIKNITLWRVLKVASNLQNTQRFAFHWVLIRWPWNDKELLRAVHRHCLSYNDYRRLYGRDPED